MPITINGTTGIAGVDGSASTPALQGTDTNTGVSFGIDTVNISTNGAQRVTVNSSGNVGIGTANLIGNASSVYLTVNGSTLGGIALKSGDATVGYLQGESTLIRLSSDGAKPITFDTNGSERARIDSSGRLLVGTSSTSANSTVLLQGNSSSSTSNAVFRLNRGEATPANGAGLGAIIFGDSTHADAAYITSERDGGTWSGSSKPSRLVFSVTADGASSPTERARITSGGSFLVGATSSDLNNIGVGADADGFLYVTRANTVFSVNRKTTDGTLVDLRQDNTVEGTISVSGTTVSYNGAHLSRWSQLPSGAERTEILRGSVLSNIDEMCEWGEEDNEQLNRMKVSDVEGDKNVSGVFQAWDDDDDTYTNDFYCAMTGDFIIRIGAGVTVERGDLLMSAGDGTAKPQDDDIIRSKTIAKVTSTNVSCTYEDGSYCVPCVLMAC